MAAMYRKGRRTAVVSGTNGGQRGKTAKPPGANAQASSAAKTNGHQPAGQPVHTEHEDFPWTINIPDHATRTDSPEYVKSRATMNEKARSVTDFFFGPAPYQDHHGGGLWLKDEKGWFIVKNVAGLEWSSQFCADPARVDVLRQNAQRLYALCPEAAKELGIEELLSTPIKDAAGVARWTDSICNASVPLRPAQHTGTLPLGGGIHHYPGPIIDIQFFKYADFDLWVLDEEGNPAAVVPLKPKGSHDWHTRLVYSTPNSKLNHEHRQAQRAGKAIIFDRQSHLTQQAYARQTSNSKKG
jgi:hypothetical protein